MFLLAGLGRTILYHIYTEWILFNNKNNNYNNNNYDDNNSNWYGRIYLYSDGHIILSPQLVYKVKTADWVRIMGLSVGGKKRILNIVLIFQ